MSFAASLIAITEDLSNRLLRLDAETLARLGNLHDKVLKLELQAPSLELFVIPSEGGMRLRKDCPRPPDVVLRGRLSAFLRLLRANDPGAVTGAGIDVEGDIELAQRFQRALAAFDADWEEPLSRVTGDIVAHRIGVWARGARTWAGEVRSALRANAAEYVQDELEVVVRQREVLSFLEGVDALREDADRLAARVDRIEAACDARA